MHALDRYCSIISNVPKLYGNVVSSHHHLVVMLKEAAFGQRIDQLRENIFLLTLSKFEDERRRLLERRFFSKITDMQEALACSIEEYVGVLGMELTVGNHFVKLVNIVWLHV